MNQFIEELRLTIPSLIASQDDIKQFLTFIQNKHITTPDNMKNHICSFFLPVHLPSSSVYLVHHRKAQDWIPPGGHIETGEHPLQTVKREFKEELGLTLTDQKIDLVALSIMNVHSPNRLCKTHYDLWYIVYCDKQYPFRYDRGEFFSASWFSFDKAVKQTKKNKKYAEILSQFIHHTTNR